LISFFDVLPKGFPFCFIISPPPSFRSQLVIFYSTLLGVFERLLGLGLLECPEALHVCQYVALHVFSGGSGLISSEVIALVAYMGSWGLVTLIIASKFLLYFRSFLLEVIGANNLGSLFF
jgi:hypothetical protein